MEFYDFVEGMYDDFAAQEEEQREIESMENEAVVIAGDFPINRNQENEEFISSPFFNNPEIE